MSEKNFCPIDRHVDAPESGEAHFKVTVDGIVLSPDEAWVLKHFIRGVDEDSPYRGISEYLSGHFIAGAYETQSTITVSHEQAPLLAGVYIGLLWELQEAEPEKAKVIKEKIDAILERQPDEIKDFFRSQQSGPENSPKFN